MIAHIIQKYYHQLLISQFSLYYYESMKIQCIKTKILVNPMKRVALVILMLPTTIYSVTFYSPFDNRSCSQSLTKGPGSYGNTISDITYRNGRLPNRGRAKLYPEYENSRCRKRTSKSSR